MAPNANTTKRTAVPPPQQAQIAAEPPAQQPEPQDEQPQFLDQAEKLIETTLAITQLRFCGLMMRFPGVPPAVNLRNAAEQTRAQLVSALQTGELQ